MSGRAAVIDLGSLAVHLHIASPRPETARGEGVREGEGDAEAPPGSPPVPFLSLHQARRISRLAENLAPGQDLPPDGQDRALQILGEFRSAIERFGVAPERTRIVATEAMRGARNGPAFARRIQVETGLPTRILSTGEEARWTAKGALLTARDPDGPTLIADPGGGSLELIRVGKPEGNAEEPPLRHAGERLGVLDLLRRFPLGAPADPETLRKLEAEVEQVLKKMFDAIGPFKEGVASVLITGGTALNLAAIRRQMAPERAPAFFQTSVSREDLETIYRRLAGADLEARSKEAFLERGREDVIVPGLSILMSLIRAIGLETLTVTHMGLREGILDALLRGRTVHGPAR